MKILLFALTPFLLLMGCKTADNHYTVMQENATQLGEVRRTEIEADKAIQVSENTKEAQVGTARWEAIGKYFELLKSQADTGTRVSKGTTVETNEDGTLKKVEVTEEDPVVAAIFGDKETPIQTFRIGTDNQVNKVPFKLPTPPIKENPVLGAGKVVGKALLAALPQGIDGAVAVLTNEIIQDGQTERLGLEMDYRKVEAQMRYETDQVISNNEAATDQALYSMVGETVDSTNQTLRSVSQDNSRTNSNLAGVNGAVANNAVNRMADVAQNPPYNITTTTTNTSTETNTNTSTETPSDPNP